MKIGIISDLHSNLAATKAVFNKLESIGVEEILCTGDLIGYYTNPLEIIDFVRSRTKYVICGNHDAIAISDDLDEMQYFNSVAREALVWTRDLLATNKEYWDYIRNLPLTLKIELDGVKILLAHGTPTEPEDWEYF
ncbi:MAG TPA: metallophosphoesterase family protein, partial [Candidatus Hodarchaeales archaeon]|nr:metallophosphoesterase family protein [Candidatus Hodarchaeales archaeon]